MRIPEKTMEELVAEASQKMSDPNYSAVLVGGFVEAQAPTAQYISAHAGDLGGADAVVNTIFHAALISEAFKRANNRTVPEVTFEDLDYVAEGDREQLLKEQQPAVLEYINANIDSQSMRNVLMLLALAMEWVS